MTSRAPIISLHIIQQGLHFETMKEISIQGLHECCFVTMLYPWSSIETFQLKQPYCQTRVMGIRRLKLTYLLVHLIIRPSTHPAIHSKLCYVCSVSPYKDTLKSTLFQGGVLGMPVNFDSLTSGGLIDTGTDCSSMGQIIPRYFKQLIRKDTFICKPTNVKPTRQPLLSHYPPALITPGPSTDNQGQSQGPRAKPELFRPIELPYCASPIPSHGHQSGFLPTFSPYSFCLLTDSSASPCGPA